MRSRRYSLHCSVRNGARAPCRMVRSGLGTTRSGSTPGTRPKPWQVGQAPTGELNENRSGVGSSKRIPSRSKNSENVSTSPGAGRAGGAGDGGGSGGAPLPPRGFFGAGSVTSSASGTLATTTAARPAPSRNACSAESAMRERVDSSPARITRRSTSTSTRSRAALTLAGSVSLRSSTSGPAPFLACASVGSTRRRKKPRARSASRSSASATLGAPFLAVRSGRAKVR